MGIVTRLLHTADWQLGKQYKGLGGDPDCRSDLRSERLNAVRRLGSLAVQHRADAVLVAGDVFDMNEVSDRVVRQTLNTLAETASCGWGVRRTFTWRSRARLFRSTKDAWLFCRRHFRSGMNRSILRRDLHRRRHRTE